MRVHPASAAGAYVNIPICASRRIETAVRAPGFRPPGPGGEKARKRAISRHSSGLASAAGPNSVRTPERRARRAARALHFLPADLSISHGYGAAYRRVD